MDYEKYIKEMTKKLETENGLSDWLALRIAYLLLYLTYYKVNFRINSGFRDPKRQKMLREAWDRGEGKKYGLVVRPAADSLHSRESWLGFPAAEAVDIVTSDQKLTDDIAQYLGLGLGSKFSKSDPVHYYNPHAR